MPTCYSPTGNPEIWTEGTQPRDYMTQEEWVAAHPAPVAPAPTLENQLAMIEAEYAPKIAALQTALVAATLTDGSIMDSTISSLRAEWTALLNAKSLAMEAVLA